MSSIHRAVRAAESSSAAARQAAGSLHDLVSGAVRALGKVEIDSAFALRTGPDPCLMEDTEDHAGALEQHCRGMPGVAAELSGHLTSAFESVSRVAVMLGDDETWTSRTALELSRLRPSVSALQQMLLLARPAAGLAEHHLSAAQAASRQLALTFAEPHTFAERLARVSKPLERAEEDVLLLEPVVGSVCVEARLLAGHTCEIIDRAGPVVSDPRHDPIPHVITPARGALPR